MTITTFIINAKKILLSASISAVVWLCIGCHDLPVTEMENPLNDVIGTHTGTFHRLSKDQATGEIYSDTTFENTIEIVRLDSVNVKSIGLGAPIYQFQMPLESTENEFQSSETHPGGWVLGIWINLSDRTIKIKSTHTPWPSSLYEEADGVYKF